jgi:ADP-ribosyl-[dinitrogen reductase] hydrolase
MLIELAVGDAYGAGFEYVNTQLIRQFNRLSGYVKHPRHSTPPGHYTDDTQMSIAIAEVIVSGAEWTPLNLASKFVEVFKRDPRMGYAGGFYQFLRQVQNGQQFLDEIIPTSDKSGAAMRAAPVGVFPTISEVIEKATIQAKITHNTPNGIAAGVAAALMAHYFLYQLGPKKDLAEFLNTYTDRNWSKPWRGKVGSKGWMSVQAAVAAIMRNERISALLKDCIDFSGDVDTVATIALAAAAGSIEIAQDIPEHLVVSLEDIEYGRSYLADLDSRLMALVNRNA